jgi:peptide-methionine (S)-S-oxide reductase
LKSYEHLYFKTTKPDTRNLKEIYLGMGCFWKPESLFWGIKGIVYTEVGYAECIIDNPSCSDAFHAIPHKEVVRVIYNPNEITIDSLLDVFWNNHTIDVRDDFPVPDLYKSMIYVDNKYDFNLAVKSIKKTHTKRIEMGNKYRISTKIKKIINYVRASDNHQQYKLKNKYL